MIRFPSTLELVSGETIRAGGTDLMDRRHLGLHTGDLVDLRDVGDLSKIEVTPAGIRIGALASIQSVADHPAVQRDFPALAQAAGGLATPQIRRVATVGGNLMQRTRCNHFRAGDLRCLKLGGDRCVAETGDNIWHGIFKDGPCVAPHPSTLAVAFLALGAMVEIIGGPHRPIHLVYGPLRPNDREHALENSEAVSGVWLTAPKPGQKSAWIRAASRERAEWPLVEVVVLRGAGVVTVAVGGVSPAPMRLTNVESALQAGESDSAAAERAADGAQPLSGNAYKSRLLINTVRIALEKTA